MKMSKMKQRALAALVLATVFIAGAANSRAAELRKETLAAWDQYVAASQRQMNARAVGASSFLWADELSGRSQRLRQGEIEVEPAVGDGSLAVPHGLIHDWVGAVFIPNTSIDKVAATLRDYDRYKDFFPPAVADSRIIEHSDRQDQFAIKWVNRVLFVSAGVDAKCRTEYVRVDGHRLYSTSYSTDLREIVDYGRPSQHDLPSDLGSGYVWRLYSFARYEQRDGGVYVEIEALALTRDIPASLRFVVSPEIKKLSRKSLLVSLDQSRAAVQSSPETADRAESSDRGSGNIQPSRTAASAAFKER